MKTLIKKVLKILGVKRLSKLVILERRGLIVGKNFKMLEECIIDDSHCWHIEIGDDVTLAPRVHILAHDASTKTHLNYTKIRNVFIGNRVFIGAGSIVLPGSKIGDDVIIGAGSVVKGVVPNDSVFAGNPAKFICSTTVYMEKNKDKMKPENTFGDEFTLRKNINTAKKQKMKKMVEANQIGFVI